MMFGPKINTVFKSRWNAIWWSVGILMTAYCSVPSKDQAHQTGHAASTASATRESSAEKLATSFLHHQAPPQHVNPWAKN
jgi:hypothetical protein